MEDNNEKNENGYVKTHSRIKTVRYFIVALLLIFVVLAVMFYREDLTVENFRYLLKYVNVRPVTFGSDENTQITFESDSATVTGSFKEDLVVLTKTSLRIYDLSSAEILDTSHGLTSPTLSLGRKYFAVYDMGGKYLAIYNSFSKLWENNFKYPIYDVALDDKGNFCVATAEKDYTSSLKVYNSDFENVFNWRSVDKYSLCADIYTSETTHMAVGTIRNTPSGDMMSELVLLSADSEKIVASLEFPSEMMVKVSFNSKGNIVCLTDKALRTVSLSGRLISEYTFNSKALRKFESGDKWSVLLLNENLVGKRHMMIIFDVNGDTYMEKEIDSEITDMCVSDSHAFLLGVEDITVIDVDAKSSEKYDSERSYRSIELIDDKNVFLVYDGIALAMGAK